MKRIFKIILPALLVLLLIGCVINNDTQIDKITTVEPQIEDSEINNNQDIDKPSKEILNNQNIKEDKIDITKENKKVIVKSIDDIYDSLYKAFVNKISFINFDISSISNNDDLYLDTKNAINNIQYQILYDHQELNIIDHMESTLDNDNNLIKVKIYYFYFEKSDDLLLYQNNDQIAVILDNRIIKKGDTAVISLLGNEKDKYTIQCIPKDNNIINIENNIVNTLNVGETDIDVILKENDNTIYSGILKIKVLPENTIKTNNIKELMTVLSDNIGKDSVNILMKNIDANILYEGLQNVCSPYVFFTTNGDYTLFEPNYYESRENSLNAIKEINSKADEIINKIITPNMTDGEKIQTIYDYIIDTADYDMEYYTNDKIVDFSSRTAYGILINGQGICGGFSDSLNILLRKLGIESYGMAGQAGGDGHLWNVIKLHGEYRYFDVTFDNTDSTKETISHRYFNIDEEQLSYDHEWYKERFDKFLKALKDCK